MEEVIPRLFISGLDAACSPELKASKGITHIVSIGCQIEPKYDDCQMLEFPHIRDLPEALIVAVFDRSNSFISAALNSSDSTNVLVHCYYGQSRSAAVVRR